ncbi:MAG TPA: TldD/PmbA family protein [Ktedonobacterales bacterium]|nr:TldD/PmbA family protein [Ktedonobacterales bacterium]
MRVPCDDASAGKVYDVTRSSLLQTASELVADLEQRFPYAAALFGSASGIQISDNGGEQSASEVPPSRGLVFTIYDGSQFVEYATSTLAPDAVAREVRAWASAQRVHAGGPALDLDEADAGIGGEREFRTPLQIDPTTVLLQDKLSLARDIQRRAQGLDSRIAQVQVGYSDNTRETAYIGRGNFLEQHVTRTILSVFIAVADEHQMRFHFLQRSGTGGFELTRVTEEDLAQTADVALRLLQAEHIEPGEYDVVTDPSVSGVIAHECFGHGVELDLFPKGRARAAQYLDKRVAAPSVQMFDDPSYAGAYGSYFFDDEGELARPTQILRDGVLVRPISDFASATLAPGVHTANGRRQDFTRKVYARMSNTFFASQPVDPDAAGPGSGNSVALSPLIADVDHGIYLRQAESGMEDPAGWGIQVTAHYGEEIRNGKLTGRIFAPVGITGYVPDLLMSISAVGGDFELSAGICGKGHKEMVPVSSGGPHMRMRARLG